MSMRIQGLTALCLAGLASFSAAPASARPYQQYLQGVCVNGVCHVRYPDVPAGKILQAEMASCYMRLGYATAAPVARVDGYSLAVYNANNSLLSAEIVPMRFMDGFPISATDSQAVFAVNSPVLLTAKAGQHMESVVEYADGTPFQLSCHISGTLTP